MSLLVLFHCEAASENVEAVKAKFAEIIPDTRAYPGCAGVTVWQDADEPTKFLLVEQWESREASDAYTAWRNGRVEQDGLRALLAGLPTKPHYLPVDA